MEGGDGGEHRTYNGAIVCCHMSVEEEEEKEEKSVEGDGWRRRERRERENVKSGKRRRA